MVSALISTMIDIYKDRKLTEHALKVYAYALAIGENEGLDAKDLEILCAASVLHDVGIPKAREIYGSHDGPYQEKEGAIIVEKVMKDMNAAEDFGKRVVWLVGHHHTPKLAGDDHLLQILMEADYLVNLSENPVKYSNPQGVKDNFFKTATGKKYITILFGLK